MFDLDRWLDKYIEAVDAAFGARIVFIGLQGSYARGEAHEGSDIDVVLILNSLTLDDLALYKSAIASLEERTKICGFVSGIEELKAWDKADLFQFCRDTKALYGDLEFIAFLTGDADAERALHTAACNIYHACVHNFVHEESAEVLKTLYKSVFFALQAKHYLETGAYIAKRKDLANKLQGEDLKILTCPAQFKTKITPAEFSAYSGLLLNWAAAVIKNYGGGSNARLCYTIWSLSDIISFSACSKAPETGWLASICFRFGRPVFCTQWNIDDSTDIDAYLQRFAKSQIFWFSSVRGAGA